MVGFDAHRLSQRLVARCPDRLVLRDETRCSARRSPSFAPRRACYDLQDDRLRSYRMPTHRPTCAASDRLRTSVGARRSTRRSARDLPRLPTQRSLVRSTTCRCDLHDDWHDTHRSDLHEPRLSVDEASLIDPAVGPRLVSPADTAISLVRSRTCRYNPHGDRLRHFSFGCRRSDLVSVRPSDTSL
jgi:hypothetical protein